MSKKASLGKDVAMHRMRLESKATRRWMVRGRPLGLMIVLLGLAWSLVPAYADDTPPEPAVVPPGYAPRGLGTTYLALGDSLATGTEAAANNDGLPGYPATLAGYLRTIKPDLLLKNLAKDGETSTSMITGTAAISSQLDLAVAFIKSERTAGRTVGLVTLDIGGNDLLPVLLNPLLNPDAALAMYKQNLAIILDRLQAALTVGAVGDGDLLLMDYYNPYPGLKSKFPQIADPDVYVPALNAIIKEAAAARGIPVAEVAAAFAGNEANFIYVKRPYADIDANYMKNYDYHPRPAGHQAIANSFFAVSGYRLNVALPIVIKP